MQKSRKVLVDMTLDEEIHWLIKKWVTTTP